MCKGGEELGTERRFEKTIFGKEELLQKCNKETVRRVWSRSHHSECKLGIFLE